MAALLLSCLTLSTLLVASVETRLLDPRFLLRHLQSAGVFERVAADGVPEEARRLLQTTYPGTSAEVADEVAVWAGRLATAEWLARRAEQFLKAALRYLGDDRSSLSVVIPLADRVEAVQVVLAARIEESPLAGVAYERLISLAAERFASVQSGLPFGVTTEAGVWERALRIAVTPEWLAGTLDDAVRAVGSWLTGHGPLEILLPLEGQRDRLGEAMELVVAESSIDDYFRDQVVRPALVGQLEEQTVVPETDLVFRREELVSTLETLTDLEWAQEQRTLVVGVLVDYLTRRRDDVAITLDLSPLATQAAERLTQLVEGRVRAWHQTRPRCRSGQTALMFVGALSPVACRPSGAPVAALEFLVSAYVRDQVASAVTENMPVSWTLDEQTLREHLSGDAWQLILRARDWMNDGVRLDQATLGRLLEVGAVEDGAALLGAARRLVRDGLQVGLEALGASSQDVTKPLDLTRTALDLLDRSRGPVAALIVLCILFVLANAAWSVRARLRLLGVAVCAAAAGSMLLTRLAEDIAEPALARLLPTPDDAPVLAAALSTLPRAASSMLDELADITATASQGVLALGVLLIGVSTLMGNARGVRRGAKAVRRLSGS